MTMFLRCLLVALVAAGAAARTANTEKTKVQLAYEKYNLVPYPVKVAPKNQFYEKKTSGATADLGNELTVTDLKENSISTFDAEDNCFYTILYIDADRNEYLHFLLINVPGNHVKEGEIIVEYEGPTLEKGVGCHRYPSLVYKQPGKIEDKNMSEYQNRESFDLDKFREKYGLGDPIAGNLIRVCGEPN